jgi:hypothetical protein
VIKRYRNPGIGSRAPVASSTAALYPPSGDTEASFGGMHQQQLVHPLVVTPVISIKMESVAVGFDGVDGPTVLDKCNSCVCLQQQCNSSVCVTTV